MMVQHYKNTQRWRYKARDWATRYAGGKCQICGYDKYYGNLCFHHVDEKTKTEDVCRMIAKTMSWSSILKEIKKCVLLCHNCHNEVHADLTECPLINHEEREKILKQIQDEQPIPKNKQFHKCKSCNKRIPKTLTFCSHECASKGKERVNWPENLTTLVVESSLSAVGRNLGVSPNAVAKRLRNHH